MTVSSLLINFSKFGWAEWFVVGLLATVVLIAFVAGCAKGFSNLKIRPLSWAFACGLFVLLDVLFHGFSWVDALLKLMGVQFATPTYAALASTVGWLMVALLVRWIVFGLVYTAVENKKEALLKEAEKISYQEKVTGEEYLQDENKVYKALPVDGIIKPGPINRLFGGIFGVISACAIFLVLMAVAMVTIKAIDPLYAIVNAQQKGGLSDVCALMQRYAVDLVLVTIACAIVIKGYQEGVINGLRIGLAWLLKVGLILGAVYLPFSAWTAPGQPLEIFTIGAEKLGALLPLPEIIPALVGTILFKAVFSAVLALIAWIVAKLIAAGLAKVVKIVDNSPILWRIDGMFGAMVFILLAVVAVCAIILFVYMLEYLGLWQASKLFANDSPLMGNAYKVLDVLVKPGLDTLLAK